MAKYYLTTPIYYVNDVPHIGHAYTTLTADVLARAHRQYGDQVRFVTGTDEHGLKVAQKAAENGLEPQAYVDQIAQSFQEAWSALGIGYDEFARTTNPKHEYLVGQVFQKLHDLGHLYEGQYEGWYCVGCEEYKEVEPGNTAPVCDIHQKPLQFLTETSYYFKLSAFQDRLIAAIEADQLIIRPAGRKNEVLAFLREPLRDIPVTRSKVTWGIPVPFASDQTIYVWIDALLYYLSFSEESFVLEPNTGHQTCWPADLQLLGKDILRFHAVIWPALLMALDLPVPKELFVHGFFTINGQKMSKTIGNVIRPAELIARYGADATRYLVLSAVPYGSDGDISLEKMDAVYTAQLANGLGNLLQRTIVLINKFGIKPQVEVREVQAVKQAYLAHGLAEALVQTFQLVDDVNRYIASTQPWAMTNDAERETVLVHCYTELLKIAEALVPLMPATAEKIKNQLQTLLPEPLFPRLDSAKN